MTSALAREPAATDDFEHERSTPPPRASLRPELLRFEPRSRAREGASEGASDGPVEIAPRVYWVGHQLEGDPFQCHAYLIEHGAESVLIDPGSALTFPHVLRNVERILPFTRIRYFVCQHQDPDITGAMPLIDSLVSREDAVLVTHWRAAALLKHLALEMPFWLVEEHGWTLDLGGRVLRFVFTPYLHFPGAYCTFDVPSGTLFSSDLFGGFTREPGLYARDEGYFEDMRPFHEHYMPSREILVHGLLRLEQHPIRQIAPQHGRIIPEHLVRYMFDRLKGLDCGLYLMTRSDTDIRRLLLLNTMLRDVMRTLVSYRDFATVAAFLLERAAEVLPVDALAFYVDEGSAGIGYFAAENRFRGEPVTAPPPVREALGAAPGAWLAAHRSAHHEVVPAAALDGSSTDSPRLLIPLFSGDDGAHAVAVFRLTRPLAISEELDSVLGQVSVPLAIAVEREALHRQLEHERDRMYELSTHDALTGLHTRRYLDDAGRRMVKLHDRDGAAAFALAMLDVDFFKRVNDTHGHPVGDAVLKGVGAALAGRVRGADIAARYGGEEFALVFHVHTAGDALRIAEDLRQAVAALSFAGAGGPFQVTISAGVALHRPGESLATLLQRSDRALYEAKGGGRNRVCLAAEPRGR